MAKKNERGQAGNWYNCITCAGWGAAGGVIAERLFLRIINLDGDALITHNVYPYGTIALASNAEH